MIPMIMLFAALVQQPDSIPQDTLRRNIEKTDTLREVTVKGDSLLPVNEAIQKSLKLHPIPKAPPSLGDLLGSHINDLITHPFAIKQRKQEKRKRKHRKILEQYEHIKTFDELLREAYWQLQQEDSLEMLKKK